MTLSVYGYDMLVHFTLCQTRSFEIGIPMVEPSTHPERVYFVFDNCTWMGAPAYEHPVLFDGMEVYGNTLHGEIPTDQPERVTGEIWMRDVELKVMVARGYVLISHVNRFDRETGEDLDDQVLFRLLDKPGLKAKPEPQGLSVWDHLS